MAVRYCPLLSVTVRYCPQVLRGGRGWRRWALPRASFASHCLIYNALGERLGEAIIASASVGGALKRNRSWAGAAAECPALLPSLCRLVTLHACCATNNKTENGLRNRALPKARRKHTKLRVMQGVLGLAAACARFKDQFCGKPRDPLDVAWDADLAAQNEREREQRERSLSALRAQSLARAQRAASG